MKAFLRAACLALVFLLAATGAGCSLGSPATTTESSTTTSSTTTTEAPGSWRQVDPTGVVPSARCYQALVYDSTSRGLLMFSGFDGTSALSETWTYDASQNSWGKVLVEEEGQPMSARQMPGAYDPTTRSVVAYDGTSWGYAVAEKAWNELGPEGEKLRPTRLGACMVMDDKTGKVVLFGGTDMSVSYDETWVYDPNTNTWTNMSTEGARPPGRSDAGMAYDPVSGKVVLFGGVDSDFNCLDDTWAYDGPANTWTQVVTDDAPSARSGLAMAYDPGSRRIVLFGGIDSQLLCYNDTWAFDMSEGVWTELSPEGELPQARGRTTMAYSADIDKLVMFGGAAVQAADTRGFGYLVYLNDLWVYGVFLDDEEAEESMPIETLVTSTTVPLSNPATTSTVP